MLAQPVDKPICENGSKLPRFPSTVSIVLIKPRLYKRQERGRGFSKLQNAESRDSNPHTHCPSAQKVTGSSIHPGSQQLSSTARLSQQMPPPNSRTLAYNTLNLAHIKQAVCPYMSVQICRHTAWTPCCPHN